MLKRYSHFLIPVALLLAFFLSTSMQLNDEPVLEVQKRQDLQLKDSWDFFAASDMMGRMVHAPSVVELPDGKLRAFWFTGSREGASDVSINTSVFDPEKGLWSKETIAIERQWLNKKLGRYTRKLGNAVPVLDDSGRMRLFVVAVSFGGWAASRIIVLDSYDLGETWQFAIELKTAPMLNVSTLVKTPAIRYTDGSIGLPVYHEFIGKFGEILRIDQENRVVSLMRIGSGREAIQPLVLATSDQNLVTFLRPHDKGYALTSTSYDAGLSWKDIEPSGMENPGSALGGVSLSPEHWVIASNCNKEDRDELCIKETLDAGKSWSLHWQVHDNRDWRDKPLDYEKLLTLIPEDIKTDPEVDQEQLYRSAKDTICQGGERCKLRYDYPYMIQSKNGDLHMLYTWNKILIRHAWLKAKP